MHNSYFVINQVSGALNSRLKGYRAFSCFSQEKDELVIQFSGQGETLFTLCAHLQPSFSCLYFPARFARSRINSIDLYPEILDRRVKDVIQLPYERQFYLVFENDCRMIFQLFGNHSNIILQSPDGTADPFKKNIKKAETGPFQIDETPPDLSYDRFRDVDFDPRKFIPAFDKNVMFHLGTLGFYGLENREKYDLVTATLRQLENPSKYYLIRDDELPRISLFKPSEKEFTEFEDILEALNQLFSSRVYALQFNREKSALLRRLENELDKTGRSLESFRIRYESLQKVQDLRAEADLIMANLGNIPSRAEEFMLRDLYTGEPVKIKIKPGLSPQKYAEALYRKAKNQGKEKDILKETIRQKQLSLEKCRLLHDQASVINDLRDLRKFSDENRLGSEVRENKPGSLFRNFTFMDFEILVGKNSENNEKLTFGAGFKDELWMHARDVPGSHVLVKYRAGKNFPQPVIERAAELAAYFSKNRSNTLCPVIYTPRKYVRKLKGGGKGEVIVEKEKIIFVRPRM